MRQPLSYTAIRSRFVAVERIAGVEHQLEEAQAAGKLVPRLKTPTYPSLLVVDEIGYLPISRTGAMLFFQVMSRRYERASTVLTSNKSFEEWGEIFGDEMMAAAPDRPAAAPRARHRLSDFRPPEVSDFHPALTPNSRMRSLPQRRRLVGGSPTGMGSSRGLLRVRAGTAPVGSSRSLSSACS